MLTPQPPRKCSWRRAGSRIPFIKHFCAAGNLGQACHLLGRHIMQRPVELQLPAAPPPRSPSTPGLVPCIVGADAGGCRPAPDLAGLHPNRPRQRVRQSCVRRCAIASPHTDIQTRALQVRRLPFRASVERPSPPHGARAEGRGRRYGAGCRAGKRTTRAPGGSRPSPEPTLGHAPIRDSNALLRGCRRRSQAATAAVLHVAPCE